MPNLSKSLLRRAQRKAESDTSGHRSSAHALPGFTGRAAVERKLHASAAARNCAVELTRIGHVLAARARPDGDEVMSFMDVWVTRMLFPDPLRIMSLQS